ncbi:methyltransferase, FkbM family [Hydrogenophaga sp. T4]|nr:methyltransferase, FkbM family [Hydrogenophaga sp. T4]
MSAFSLIRWIWTHPLNDANKVGGIKRFLQWQFSQAILQKDTALPFVGDSFLFTSKGMTGATGNWYCGLHEPSDMGFVLHSLRPGDLFADIGANIGSYTILASQTGANTISFEPIPSTYNRLRQNIALNGVGDFTEARCEGISSEAGTLTFTSNFDTTNHVFRGKEAGSTPKCEVSVTTLDTACKDRTPKVIKIDVEGYESEVLKGAKKTLQSPDLLAVIIEINGNGAAYGVKDEDLALQLQAYGFISVKYDPIHRRLAKASPSSTGNTIFVRNIDQMQTLVEGSRKFKLVNTEI